MLAIHNTVFGVKTVNPSLAWAEIPKSLGEHLNQWGDSVELWLCSLPTDSKGTES